MTLTAFRPFARNPLWAPLWALPITLLSACSGGSDFNDGPNFGAGLTAPAGLSVIEPNTSDLSAGGGSIPNGAAQFPPASDYVLDVASVRVIDPAVEAIDDVNGLLCQIGMTRFSSFANRPAYLAQVDTVLCGETPEISAFGSVTPRIREFSTAVRRDSRTDPQVVSLWIPAEEGGDPVQIFGELAVSASPTEEDPFGAFQLNYAGVPAGGSIDSSTSFGVLLSDDGENGFRLVEGFGDIDVPTTSPGEQAALNQVVVTRDPVTGEGAARITQSFREFEGGVDSGVTTSSWRLVFDEDNVVRELDSNGPVALAQDDFVNHVFRYNLYHNEGTSLGQRVELNSGVNVRLSTGAFAWVGYYGAFLPVGESLADGDTVELETDAGVEVLEVRQAPGRLKRISRETVLLSELGLQRFEWYEGLDRFEIAYNGVEWQRLAIFNNATDSMQELNPPTMIDVAGAGGFLAMHSPFLGNVSFVEGDPEITYFLDTLVLGSDMVFDGISDLELFATVNAIKPEISLADANAGEVFLPLPTNVSNAYRYSLKPTDMTLRRDDGGVLTDAGFADGVEPTQGPNVGGIQSGPMVTGVKLANMTSVFDVFDEPEFYFYETGHNTFNQFIGLVNAGGEVIAFDAPLEMLHVHSTADDINGDATFDGQQVVLSYNGLGQLFGIPVGPVDLGEQEPRQLPRFSLRDGTVVGPNGEYVVRALGVEQTLAVDAAGASQLDITDADALVLPDASLYVAPTIGPPPTIIAPPAVINGEIQ